MDPQVSKFGADFDDDFDDAEDFDDPEWAAAPVAAPHASVIPKPSKPKADPWSSTHAYEDEYDEYGDFDDHGYPTAATANDVSLPRTRLFLRSNRLQQLGKNAGEAMRCDISLSQISKVEVRFAPSFADLVLVFFFAGLTVALLELLPSGWLRGILGIIAGLFAAGMFFGVIVTRSLRVHTPDRVFDIVVDDDVREAEAFAASLQARIHEHHSAGPFR